MRGNRGGGSVGLVKAMKVPAHLLEFGLRGEELSIKPKLELLVGSLRGQLIDEFVVFPRVFVLCGPTGLRGGRPLSRCFLSSLPLSLAAECSLLKYGVFPD